MEATKTENGSVYHRAKQWQIALFPFNNAATNVYFAFYSYFTNYAILYLTGSVEGALVGTVALGSLCLAVSAFTAVFAPLMRVFDGITDPICGGMMDRAQTRFGKFRPFMVVGNAILAVSVLIMMIFFRWVSDEAAVLRWVIFIVSYIIYVLGYTAQCAVTKAGQTCLTNDPKQRSQFMIWNMVGQLGSIVLINVMAGGVLTNEALCAKGLIVYDSAEGLTVTALLAELSAKNLAHADIPALALKLDPTKKYTYALGAAYGPMFYNIMVPFVIVLSAIYTIMAVAAISEHDNAKFWGVAAEQPKLRDYANVIKKNKEIRYLVISAGCNKLASTVATSGPVAFLLFGCLMGDYNGLFIPFYVLCFIFMGLFFIWGSKTAGEKGQKRGMSQFTILAFLFYIGVMIMLFIFDPGNEATHLSLFSTEGGFHLTINAYTIIFIILYGCGYGAFNCCDQMTIPMVADCTDYETFRSGKYVPGIMGTLFSFVDKLISSLQVLLLQVFIVAMVPGLNVLPVEGTPYMEGMKLSCILCFCVLPMASWLITMICMLFYGLSGKKLVEVQAVNAVRKAAIEGGMSSDEAIATWTSIDQVPAEFVPVQKTAKKASFFDKIYNAIFTKNEKVSAEPSSNAIPIPAQYVKKEEPVETPETTEAVEVEATETVEAPETVEAAESVESVDAGNADDSGNKDLE